VETVFGLPAHPQHVHIPVVLLPLAAIGVLVMAIKPAWHHRYRWAVLVIGAAGTIGAILAADAGEGLEEQARAAGRANTWEEHAEAGDTARNFAILFFIFLVAFVAVPWFLDRRAAAAGLKNVSSGESAATSGASAAPRWLKPLLTMLVIAAGAVSMITIIDAGHSGAKSVWDSVQQGSGG